MVYQILSYVKSHLHSNPNANVQSKIKRIIPNEKMINSLKKIDCVEVFSFFLDTLNKLKKLITKIMTKSAIPKNVIVVVPLSMICCSAFHNPN